MGPALLHSQGKLVKGVQFRNDRVVGTLEQGIRVQNARNVDEVCLIDVSPDEGSRAASLTKAVSSVSRYLRVPLLAGGGIKSIREIDDLFRVGADRVLLGRKAISAGLAGPAAAKYGRQSIVACVEIGFASRKVVIKNQWVELQHLVAIDYIDWLFEQGCGEVLIINPELDGTREGVQSDLLLEIASSCHFPIAYQGGVRDPSDATWLARAGFSSIFSGALFQFSRFTPNDLKRALKEMGFTVRI